MDTIDFTINNDEIEKISKRIHELQNILGRDVPLSKEQMEEYTSLFRLKDLLYRANQVDNQDNFIVIDGMRIERSKVNEFKELLKIVNIPGLATIPNYLGDILPGTKYKMPRVKNDEETFYQYEEYLKNYYKKLGYKFERVTYHPGTTVPNLREPYPHEMYYPSDNGYIYDDSFFGTHNEYYQELKIFLENELALQYQEMIKNAIENYSEESPVYGDINKRHKVIDMEPFVLFIKLKKSNMVTLGEIRHAVLPKKKNEDTPLISALKESARTLMEVYNASVQNNDVDVLEGVNPTLKINITIPEELKKALASVPSNSSQRVINSEFSINKLIGRAKDMLPKYLAEATRENFDVIEVQEGFSLYKLVPKDILIGNALSKKTVKEKRIAYELASKFRRLMNSDSALSHYHDMLLKNFLEANKEKTTGEETIKETAITPNNMRI